MDICEQCDGRLGVENADRPQLGTRTFLFRRVWRALVHKIRMQRSHRARRRAFKKLLLLDEKVLSDIGVTREELLLAQALPLSVNASQELYRMSLTRRRKEQSGELPR